MDWAHSMEKRPDLKNLNRTENLNKVNNDREYLCNSFEPAQNASSADEQLQHNLYKLIDELNLVQFSATSSEISSESKPKSSKCNLENPSKVFLIKEAWSSFTKLRLVFSLEVSKFHDFFKSLPNILDFRTNLKNGLLVLWSSPITNLHFSIRTSL